VARTRNLKPGFFKNEQLCELPPLARLLFAGLWTIADRAGRLEDRPKRIKAEILPYEEKCNTDSLLSALNSAGFILRYEAGGNKYISILTWDKHQNPHVKEPTSTIPAPGRVGAGTVQAPDSNSTKPVTELPSPNHLVLGSGADAPDYSPPMHAAQQPRAVCADLNGPTSPKFSMFWDRWPFKQKREMAARMWISVVTVDTESEVFACLDRFLSSDQASRNVIGYAHNWIQQQHQDGWRGDWPAAKGSTRMVQTRMHEPPREFTDDEIERMCSDDDPRIRETGEELARERVRI
jgi:hypothetical protein